jgi:hypothetical protein
VLGGASDKVIGLRIIGMFIVDLLGYGTNIAVMFSNKMQED